jgi:hypothetical protein
MITLHTRNGKLRSCEPCRARKLACDHRIPACGRCLRTIEGPQCYYHTPALTTPKPGQDARTNAGISGELVRIEETSDTLSGLPSSQRPRLGDDRSPNSNISSSADEAYFGELSSFAAIAELNRNLGSDVLHTPVGTSASSTVKVPSHQKLEVLRRLQDTDRLGRLLDRWFSIRAGYLIYHPVYCIWLNEMRKTFRDMSRSASDKERFWHLCDMVDRNTESHFSSTGPLTPRDWAHQCSGPKLRWETIGLIFCAVGLMAGSFSQWDTVFTTNDGRAENRWDLANTMLRMVNECIGFCRDIGCCNDLLACLLFESTLLLERVQGCSYPAAWLRMGETCDMVVMLGFHRQKRVDSATPFYLCELRIRLIQQIYCHDKFLSTYLGRPPCLSYRYCAMQLVHDVSDDDICSDTPESRTKLSQLKEVTCGAAPHSRSFWRKMWTPHAVIMEDILEISLGVSDEDLDIRIARVRAKIDEAYGEMPAFLQIDPMDTLQKHRQFALDRSVSWRPLDILCALGHHCGIRHTNFMLERAIVNRSISSKERLIVSARSLLDLVLKVLQLRDYFRDFQADLVVLVSIYNKVYDKPHDTSLLTRHS